MYSRLKRRRKRRKMGEEVIEAIGAIGVEGESSKPMREGVSISNLLLMKSGSIARGEWRRA